MIDVLCETRSWRRGIGRHKTERFLTWEGQPTFIDVCEQELTTSWRELMEALASGDKPEIARRTLHYAYYWCASQTTEPQRSQCLAAASVNWFAALHSRGVHG